MTWSKAEAKIVDKQTESIERIEKALLGDMETKEPGLIDDVRDMKTDINTLKKDNKAGKRRHISLFIISTLSFVLIGTHIYGKFLTFDFVSTLITNIIKAIF